MQTLSSAEQEELESLLPLVAGLPLILRVDAEIPFNVAHGDLLALNLDQETLEQVSEIPRELADISVWSRKLYLQAVEAAHLTIQGRPVILSNEARQPGLNLTYVGHTILKNIFVHRSHVFIDQGAYKWVTGQSQAYGLTLLEHNKFAPELMQAIARRLPA